MRTFSIVATVLDLKTRAFLTWLQPHCFPSQIILVELDIFIFLEMYRFSLFNHSCSPNVCISNVGKTMRARAIRPIRQGEEVL